jgi:hypothetical protein
VFNYTATQAEVATLIKDMGVLVTLQKLSGTNIKTSIVWGKDAEDSDDALVVLNTKVCYMPGNIKKAPEVGDNIVLGTLTWGIQKVEAYKPAKSVIAFKITVLK